LLNDCCLQKLWPKLCKPEKAQAVLEAMQAQQKQVVKQFQEGCAVLPLLEAHMVEAACDDPGALIVPHLVLPLLREHLEAKTLQLCAGNKLEQASCSKVSTTGLQTIHFRVITANLWLQALLCSYSQPGFGT